MSSLPSPITTITTGGRADMRTLAHQGVVCEVPTRFVISAYSDRVMIVVTQADNMGTLVSAAAKASARVAGPTHFALAG